MKIVVTGPLFTYMCRILYVIRRRFEFQGARLRRALRCLYDSYGYLLVCRNGVRQLATEQGQHIENTEAK